jgi:hypothetical protein
MQAGESHDNDGASGQAAHKVWIDDIEHLVADRQLSGRALKALAQKPGAPLYLDQGASPDIPISDDDVVQIQGGEQFRTTAVRKAYKIFIDGTEFIVESEEMTGEQIKRLAEKPQDYKLFLERPGQPDLLIRDEEVVRIRDGEHFHTVPPANFG